MISTRSEDDLRKAKKCTDLLFGKQGVITKEMIEDVLTELPMVRLEQREKQWSVVEVLVQLGLADSNSMVQVLDLGVEAAKRLITNGGVKVNGKPIKQMNYLIQEEDMIDSCILPVQVGKKQRKFALLQSF